MESSPVASRSPDPRVASNRGNSGRFSFAVRRALGMLREARELLLAPLGDRPVAERRAELERGRDLALLAKELLARELGCSAEEIPWTLPELPPSAWPDAVAEESAGLALPSSRLSLSALRASVRS